MMQSNNKSGYHGIFPRLLERCVNTQLAHHHDATNCLNCGAGIEYHYCPVCGQETTHHVASAREFLHEFIGHYVALEGKLWQTLKYLLFRPGFLTAEYIAGRRVRYVQPLRVYLTFSILFFAVFKYSGLEFANFNTTPVPPVSTKEGAKAVKTPGLPSLGKAAENVDPKWGEKIVGLENQTPEERSKFFATAFFSNAPYAIFLLMPLFALYLKILYLGSGKRYGEHMLFALHANAFAFIMLGLALVVPWTLVQVLLIGWLTIYLPKAMRRVYGGGKFITFVRWSVLVVLHLFSIGAAILSAIGMAIVA